MVCMEEVCSWFRELYPPKRLELLCGLLQMCLPLELRFIGSYVEDLAKKDYYYLRDAENRANDPQEMKKLTDVFDTETRAKITTYLALLHSSNTVCSSTLYNTLTCTLLPALERSSLHVDKDIHSEVLLTLTMAAYHPSFSFSQRHRLFCELHTFQKLLKDHSSLSQEHCQPNSDCSTKRSSSSNHGSCGDKSQPPDTQASLLITNTSLHSSPRAKLTSNRSPAKTPVCNGTGRSCGPSPVFVKNVEVIGCNNQDRKSEFIIQVTWSNGHVVQTSRTYQQLQQFHAELLKLFPKDAGAHKQERQIPFLPQDKGPSTDPSEMEANIKKYIGQLSVLQDHIVKCDHVTAFFRSSATPIPPTSPSRLPPPASLPVTSAASMSSVTTSPLTITVESGQTGGGPSPRMLPPFSGTNSPASSYSCSTYQINQGSPSSSGSSPLVSPSSSISCPTTALVSPRTDIALWLKSIRLHKYADKLTRFTFDELSSLSEQQLEQEGLTVGARKKFTTEMIKWKQVPNGIVLDGSYPQPSFYNPAHSYAASPSMDTHSNALSGNLSGVDSCSMGSECSSPPNSPILGGNVRRDSTSSGDADKDNQNTESVVQESSEGLLPTPPHCVPDVNSIGLDPVSIGYRSNGSILGPPPGVRDGLPTNGPFMPMPNSGPIDMKMLQEGILHQYPPGVRPLIHGLFENCCPPRGPHLRTLRGPLQHVQPVRTLPIAVHTSANTTPVMPSPKVTGNSSGTVYENGQQQLGPNQSFSYVPNPNHGSLHGHPPPLGAVPHTHPPKVNVQYSDSLPPALTLTLSTATDTVISKTPHTYMPRMNSSPATVPTSTVTSTCVITWPNSVNTAASTSLTYSMVQMQPIYNATSDNNSKLSLGQSSHQPLVPPITSTEFPAYYSVPYSAGHMQAPASASSPSVSSPNSLTSSSGPSNLQIPNLSTPPTPVTTQSHLAQHPPPLNATPTTLSSCSSCGCHGNCSNNATTTPTPTPPPQPQPLLTPATVATAAIVQPPPPLPPPAYHLWYMQQAAMWQNSHMPYLPNNSNGLISHNMQFPHMTHGPVSAIKDLSTDGFYHPQNFWLNTQVTATGSHHYSTNYASGTHPSAANINNSSSSTCVNGNGIGKKPMCYNCGQSGHWATDCKEPTMDAMSHSGTFHLRFRPKTQDLE